MEDDARLFALFMEVQRGLPRQGPGCAAATRDALALCAALPAEPAILDVGCGPGMQTRTLAQATGGTVTAVDLHQEFLDQLDAAAQADGLADRIETRAADMTDLPFDDGAFDLIWAEGSAYIMGVDAALAAWRRLLRPGGYLVFSDMVWFTDAPPDAATAFFAEEYPDMRAAEAVAAAVEQAGYALAGTVPVPDAGWWDDYYTPLEAKLPGLRETHAGDAMALEVIAATAREIDMRRRFGGSYGYMFYAGRAA